jgi:hypothetical protein
LAGRAEKHGPTQLSIPEFAVHDFLKHVLCDNFLHWIYRRSRRFPDFGSIQAVHAQHCEHTEMVSVLAGLQPTRYFHQIHSVHLGGASTCD